jgi:hypothetical protein
MNWKLIFMLSAFGVLMGVASVFGLTRGIEPLLWLVIWIFCAYWITRQARTKLFQHGFMVGLTTGLIALLIQVALFSTYAANNPEFNREVPGGWSARTLFLITTPFISVISGLVLGLLCWATGKIFKQSPA